MNVKKGQIWELELLNLEGNGKTIYNERVKYVKNNYVYTVDQNKLTAKYPMDLFLQLHKLVK
jgi:hypothetical protein